MATYRWTDLSGLPKLKELNLEIVQCPNCGIVKAKGYVFCESHNTRRDAILKAHTVIIK